MIKSLSTAALMGTLFAAGAAHADNVEVYVLDMLDNKQKGYCLDVAGGREENADPADGLQGHTCYSPGGALGYDQTFDTDKFADGMLFMTNFEVCAEVSALEAGASVGLTECTDSELQDFTFSGEGTITTTAAPEMCLTVGEDTRSGRSDANQIKVLSLETCDEAKAAYQTWGVRDSVE